MDKESMKKDFFDEENLIAEISATHDLDIEEKEDSNSKKKKENEELATKNRRMFRLAMFSLFGIFAATGAGLWGYTYFKKQNSGWETMPLPKASFDTKKPMAFPSDANALNTPNGIGKEPIPLSSDQALLAQMSGGSVTQKAPPATTPATNPTPSDTIASDAGKIAPTAPPALTQQTGASAASIPVEDTRIEKIVRGLIEQEIAQLEERIVRIDNDQNDRIEALAKEIAALKKQIAEIGTIQKSTTKQSSNSVEKKKDEEKPKMTRIDKMTIASQGDGFVIAKTSKGALVYFAEGKKTPYGIVEKIESNRIVLSGYRYIDL